MQTALYPPGPRTLRPLGYLRRLRRDPLDTFLSLQQQYGDYVRFRIGARWLYLVNDPEVIRDILITHDKQFVKTNAFEFLRRVLGEGLLTSEGEFHLKQRRMIQPAFHRQRLVMYAGAMADYAERTAKRWQPNATLDVHEEMMRMTLAIVGKTLFGADVEGEAPEIGVALASTLENFSRFSNPLTPILDRLPLRSNRRFAQGVALLDATIGRLIAEHRASGDQGDLLSILLDAQEEGTGMSDRQVRDEALTLFLAGHETTANLLTWTWYLLSQNPEVAEKLHREVDPVVAERRPGFDDLPRLPYTRMVLSEAMRMYPPAYTIGRTGIQDYRIGPYTAPAGSPILMSQWVMHHDPRWYPDPWRFDPERWTPEAQAGRPKFAYFPFGGGSRVCIGEQFAWTEGTLALAILSHRWQPRLVPGFPVATRPLVTLRPRYGMKMVLEPRAERS